MTYTTEDFLLSRFGNEKNKEKNQEIINNHLNKCGFYIDLDDYMITIDPHNDPKNYEFNAEWRIVDALCYACINQMSANSVLLEGKTMLEIAEKVKPAGYNHLTYLYILDHVDRSIRKKIGSRVRLEEKIRKREAKRKTYRSLNKVVGQLEVLLEIKELF